MSRDSSKSTVQRGIDWLRGLLAKGGRAGGEAVSKGRAAVGEARDKVDESRSRGEHRTDMGTGAAGRVSDRGTSGDGSGAVAAGTVAATAPSVATSENAAAGEEDTLDEELAGDRSDFDDAAGTYVEGDDGYDTVSADPDEANRLHDAVGGHDDEADETTDGVIDTTRDEDLAHRQAPEVGQDIPGASEQDELTAFEGASADEFATQGVPEPDVDLEDVETAAEGVGATHDSPRQVAHQHDLDGTPDAVDPGVSSSARYAEVQEYNYGLGDLGVGRATSGGTTDAAGPAGEDAADDEAAETPSGTASRTEMESSAAFDAPAQGDEAVGAPGVSDAAAFDDAETGTTDPSRSATGNELEEGQDALGTTLEYDEDEASPYDTDAANLSAQEELVVTEGESTRRVATFQSGTIAHDGPLNTGVTTVDTDSGTADSYADFPDTPTPEDADDTGRDDFSGGDYPSDRWLDPLAGDDAWDAVTPDADEEGSSAGDLDTAASAEDLLIAEEGLVDSPGEFSPVDRTVDQDMVGTSDEHVGGEEPAFAESASRGTDEAGIDDVTGVQDGPGTLDMGLEADRPAGLAGAGVPDVGDVGTGGATGVSVPEDEPELGGMGVSDGRSATATVDDVSAPSRSGRPVPAGAVPGDGTTATPEGYPVKGNASSMIYHLPNFPSYATTKAEFCFASEEDAVAAGYRAPGRRNRGKSRS